MGKTSSLEDRQTYLRLNFHSEQKYGDAHSKLLAMQISSAHLSILLKKWVWLTIYDAYVHTPDQLKWAWLHI